MPCAQGSERLRCSLQSRTYKIGFKKQMKNRFPTFELLLEIIRFFLSTNIYLDPVSIHNPTVAVGAPEFSVATLMLFSIMETSVGGVLRRCSLRDEVAADL